MNRLNKLLVGTIIMLFAVVTLASGSATAAPSTGVSAAPLTTQFVYEGRLGNLSGTYDFQFRLFDAASGGTLVGSPTSMVVNDTTVTQGEYQVVLNFGAAAFKGDARYLEVGYRLGTSGGAYTIHTGRKPILPVAYALSLRPGAVIAANSATAIMRGANTGTGVGLWGSALSNAGVYGTSSSSNGVSGVSQTGSGVYGQSTNGNGVRGIGGNINHGAVVGINTAGGFGMYGESTSGAGVVGKSTSWIGTYGESTSAPGVQGKSTTNTGTVGESRDWVGVYGVSTNYEGVRGESRNRDHGGVVGVNTAGGIAVYGVSTAGGYAMYADGKMGTKVLEIQGGSDLAERFDTQDNVAAEPGTLMVIDEINPGKLKVSNEPYDTKVAGIVSGAGNVKPGLTLHQAGVMDGKNVVAIAGRVYVKADATNAPIKPGDLLTTSDIPGTAMKVTDRDRGSGAIIGKAMSGLDHGTGLVLVLVNLQ